MGVLQKQVTSFCNVRNNALYFYGSHVNTKQNFSMENGKRKNRKWNVLDNNHEWNNPNETTQMKRKVQVYTFPKGMCSSIAWEVIKMTFNDSHQVEQASIIYIVSHQFVHLQWPQCACINCKASWEMQSTLRQPGSAPWQWHDRSSLPHLPINMLMYNSWGPPVCPNVL